MGQTATGPHWYSLLIYSVKQDLIEVNILHVYWEILHAFLMSADFFKINFFEKFFQEYHQNVKQIGSRSGPMFVGPDLVQTVCKSYQQTTLVGIELNSRQTQYRTVPVSFD